MIGYVAGKKCGICRTPLRAVAVTADKAIFVKAAPAYVCVNCDRA